MHSILYNNNNNNNCRERMSMDVLVCVHAIQPGDTCRNNEIDTEQQQTYMLFIF